MGMVFKCFFLLINYLNIYIKYYFFKLVIYYICYQFKIKYYVKEEDEFCCNRIFFIIINLNFDFVIRFLLIVDKICVVLVFFI